MSMLDAMRFQLRALFRRHDHDAEIAEEIEHHLLLETLEQEAAARRASEASSPRVATPADHRRRALRVFGNVTQLREARRRASGVAVWDALRQDARFAVRIFARRRVFATVTATTLALGIGAATAIFSVADIVLFRPLPLRDAARVVTVWQTREELKLNPARAAQWDRGGVSMPAFRRWRAGQRSFDDVAIWTPAATIIDGRDGPEEVPILRASRSMLAVLDIQPALGRGFTKEEDDVGGVPVALVSHAAWMERFGGTPAVLGARVRIDGVGHTIVGVLPPRLTLQRNTQAAFWTPAGQDAEAAQDAGSESYMAIARLARGVSSAAAAAETRQFLQAEPVRHAREHDIRITPLQDDQTRAVRRPLLLLLSAAGLLLLVACANAGTLLLGEASSREPELRARAALGATTGRIMRQLLTESVLLALVAGVVGAGFAYVLTGFVVRFGPPSIPGLAGVRVDLRILGIALAGAGITGVLFGLVPAVSLSHASVRGGLRLGGGHPPRGRARSQQLLIACEVALSMLLLVAAGLLVQSFRQLAAVNPGFRAERLLVAQLRLPQPQYADSLHQRALIRALEDRVSALPGVAGAAVTTTPPFSGGSSSSSFDVDGPRDAHAPPPEAQRRIVTARYFTTAGGAS